jgi:hypothetical protein
MSCTIRTKKGCLGNVLQADGRHRVRFWLTFPVHEQKRSIVEQELSLLVHEQKRSIVEQEENKLSLFFVCFGNYIFTEIRFITIIIMYCVLDCYLNYV